MSLSSSKSEPLMNYKDTGNEPMQGRTSMSSLNNDMTGHDGRQTDARFSGSLQIDARASSNLQIATSPSGNPNIAEQIPTTSENHVVGYAIGPTVPHPFSCATVRIWISICFSSLVLHNFHL